MLNRNIRKWDLVLMMINSIIGAGIFGLPSQIYKLSGVYSLAAFFICAVVVFIIILNFAEVSSRFNKTGGAYLYALDAFGYFPGFMIGWLLLFGRISMSAALINLLVTYLSYFSSSFSHAVVRALTIIIVIMLLSYINHIGVKNSTRLNNILTVTKLLALSAFIIVGMFHLQPLLFKSDQGTSFSSLSTSVLLLVYAFGGSDGVVANTGEIKNPSKVLPFALLLSAIIVAVFYCLIQVVSIGTLPSLASSEKPLAEAAGIFMGKTGGILIAAGAIISIIGTSNVGILSGSRIPFALSEEGQFPKVFSHTHEHYLTPTWSLLLFSGITIIVSITGSFMYALTIGAIIRVLIYLSVCASLIKLRKKRPLEENYFKLRFGYFFAFAGMLFSLFLLSGSNLGQMRDTAICLFAGSIFYGLSNKFKNKSKGSIFKVDKDSPLTTIAKLYES